VIKHPAEIRIGDTVIFDVPSFANSIGTTIDNTYTLTWYGRTNTNHKGAAVTAANQGDGWRVTIAAVRKLILIKYRLPSERFLTVAQSRVTQLLDAICRSMS
jgi:hypothetical protein